MKKINLFIHLTWKSLYYLEIPSNFDVIFTFNIWPLNWNWLNLKKNIYIQSWVGESIYFSIFSIFIFFRATQGIFCSFMTSPTKMRRVSVQQSRGNSGALCVAAAVNTQSSRSLFGHWALCLHTDFKTRRSALRPPWHFACGRPAWRPLFTLCCINNGSVPSLAFALSCTKNVFCHGRAASPLCVLSVDGTFAQFASAATNAQTVKGSCPAGGGGRVLCRSVRDSEETETVACGTHSRYFRYSSPDTVSVFSLHEDSLPDSWLPHQTMHVWLVNGLYLYEPILQPIQLKWYFLSLTS